MLNRALAAVSLVALFLLAPHAYAQPANYAIAGFGQGNILDGCLGEFCVDPINQQSTIVLNVVCVDRAANPDVKKMLGEIQVVIPDGTGLSGMRLLWTTGVVEACGSAGVTVPRTNVILPVLQFGQ